MATTEVVAWKCDWDGEQIPDGTRVQRRASVDGKRFQVDLCKQHSDALDEILARFAGSKPKGARRSERSRRNAAGIRAWASCNGIEVESRGRIPANVVARYEARGEHQ
jgi:hypothetical protein